MLPFLFYVKRKGNPKEKPAPLPPPVARSLLFRHLHVAVGQFSLPGLLCISQPCSPSLASEKYRIGGIPVIPTEGGLLIMERRSPYRTQARRALRLPANAPPSPAGNRDSPHPSLFLLPASKTSFSSSRYWECVGKSA